MVLSDADRVRLIRLLGMLNSTFEAERATAAAMADRFIRDRKLTWEQVINGKASAPPPPPPPPPPPAAPRTWLDVIEDCLERPNWLTEWERGFLDNVGFWSGSLSERQKAVLVRIARKLSVKLADDHEEIW